MGTLFVGIMMRLAKAHNPKQLIARRMTTRMIVMKRQVRAHPKLPAGSVRTFEPGALGMGRAAGGRIGECSESCVMTRVRLAGCSRTGCPSGRVGTPIWPAPVQP